MVPVSSLDLGLKIWLRKLTFKCDLQQNLGTFGSISKKNTWRVEIIKSEIHKNCQQELAVWPLELQPNIDYSLENAIQLVRRSMLVQVNICLAKSYLMISLYTFSREKC